MVSCLLDHPVKPDATSTNATFASVVADKAGPGISPRASAGPVHGSSELAAKPFSKRQWKKKKTPPL